MNPDNTLTAYRVTQIIEALHGRALTVEQLASAIGLCRTQAGRYAQELHAAGTIHIAKWTIQVSGRATRLPVYAAGAGRDKPRPAVLTPAQRQAAYKARLRRDVDRAQLARAKDRARKRKPVRDPLVVAMFGAGAARGVTYA